MTCTKIQAKDVRPGDYIARARTHTFERVESIDPPGATSVYINLHGGHRVRPRLDSWLWRRDA